jgi:tRNA A37 threonylcarbamoyladenosine dehydratase
VNGSLIHITGIFGFMITNVVVNEVMKRINSVDNQAE